MAAFEDVSEREDLSVWHGDLRKRRPTGGRKRPHRKKRRYESGSFPTETVLGRIVRRKSRRRGGNLKFRLIGCRYACVSDKEKGTTVKVEIHRVVRNPASVDYDRRGVITKGTLIETPVGIARVTSRPGQDGVVNSVLISKDLS